MAYFPNGTSAEIYEATYCQHCRHMKPDDGGCAVMMAHLIHNYDQTDNPALQSVLSMLIPIDDLEAQQCAMFSPFDEDRCRSTPDMFG